MVSVQNTPTHTQINKLINGSKYFILKHYKLWQDWLSIQKPLTITMPSVNWAILSYYSLIYWIFFAN